MDTILNRSVEAVLCGVIARRSGPDPARKSRACAVVRDGQTMPRCDGGWRCPQQSCSLGSMRALRSARPRSSTGPAALSPLPQSRRRWSGLAGRVEADPGQAWAAAVSVLRQMAAAAAPVGPIVAMGLAGAMVGAWVLSMRWPHFARGHQLGGQPRKWPDRRDEAAGNPALLTKSSRGSGSALQQGCTLPVTAALLRQEPRSWRGRMPFWATRTGLRLRLTGEFASDVSEAAVAPGDARTQGRAPR